MNIVQKCKRLWAWAKRNKLMLLAAVLSAGEGAVTFGIDLPFSDRIPPQFRGALIAILMGAAFVARVLAQRKEDQRAKR
jgi:hypothetical protein